MKEILENHNISVLDERRLLSLHASLSAELFSTEEVGRFRNYPVGVTGANYTPPIARTQPFADCNKRTSRLVEAIELMSAGYVPCYSAAPADIIAYRNAIIHFYETQDYSVHADYFLSKLSGRL